MEAYKIMPDDELFSFESVRVDIPQKDMPGKPRNRVRCGSCGEYVQDRRVVMLNGKALCKACAYGKYYTSQEMDLDEQ